MRTPATIASSRCSRSIASCPTTPRGTACRCGSTPWRCTGRGNGGACWLSCQLYTQLELDRFWADRLPNSREGTSWRHILQTPVCYRLIDPGSEWRLHRQWFDRSAMADLLGADDSLAEKNALYRCLDRLLEHKEAPDLHAFAPIEVLRQLISFGRRSFQVLSLLSSRNGAARLGCVTITATGSTGSASAIVT